MDEDARILGQIQAEMETRTRILGKRNQKQGMGTYDDGIKNREKKNQRIRTLEIQGLVRKQHMEKRLVENNH